MLTEPIEAIISIYMNNETPNKNGVNKMKNFKNIDTMTQEEIIENQETTDAQEWFDSDEKWIHCVDTLNMGVDDTNVDYYVEKLENHYEEMLGK